MNLRQWLCDLFCEHRSSAEKITSESRKELQVASHHLANQAAKVQAAASVLTRETDVLTSLVKDMNR